MKAVDVIIALVLGRILGFLLGDFLREWEIHINLSWTLVIWLVLPLVSLLCLWIAQIIGRRMPFVYQGAKHLLVGAAATVIDLKFFEFLVGYLIVLVPFFLIFSKGISFFISTILKYWGNKYWAFLKHDKEDQKKEVLQFFLITLMGLMIDVVSFYFFVRMPHLLPDAIWLKVSVISAALIAAVWNFIGYKFFVFKK